MATLKVRCIKDEYQDGFFTVGKVYEATPYDGVAIGSYWDVVNDHGVRGLWATSRFEIVEEEPKDVTARDTQVGGNHYSKLPIQPYEYITANGIGMIEGNVIKYVTRWKDKGGVEDLKKAVHSLQWLIDYTEKKA